MDGSDKQLSLYDRLGEEAIERAVYLFYDKVLADDRVRHFFKNVNTAILAQHQYNFLLTVTGGPGAYTGRTLRDAHRKLVLGVSTVVTVSTLPALEPRAVDSVSTPVVSVWAPAVSALPHMAKTASRITMAETNICRRNLIVHRTVRTRRCASFAPSNISPLGSH